MNTIVSGTLRVVLGIIFFLLFLVFAVSAYWFKIARDAFSYDGKRKLAKDIVKFVSQYIEVEKGGSALEVGCGSGALTIEVAKNNRDARIVGLDRWGKEYSNYSKKLCENNAYAEGVSNAEFVQGDANKLDFPDETFDSVFSNYVYHNIKGRNRQELLMETLRVLKKGGTFAIHDLIKPSNYGDMDIFVRHLKDLGYQDVNLIETTDGKLMSKKEARTLMLGGSKLLYGKK